MLRIVCYLAYDLKVIHSNLFYMVSGSIYKTEIIFESFLKLKTVQIIWYFRKSSSTTGCLWNFVISVNREEDENNKRQQA